MKLTIERGLLMKVLGHVQSVVERRNTIPVLSNVKFDAQGEFESQFHGYGYRYSGDCSSSC